MNLVKTDLDGFSRDLDSNAIINTNVEKMEQYKRQRAERLKLQQTSVEVEELRQDVAEIKALLLELLQAKRV